MNKKIERAVDEIIILYYQGVPVKFAIDSVLKKLNMQEKHELNRLLKKIKK